MADNIKIRMGNDGIAYPYTSPDIVVDENGESMTNKINNINTQLENYAVDYAKKTDIPKSATDVGADATGTAVTKVSEHNISTSSHNDIRLLITNLTNKLNALADSDDTTLDQMSEIVAYIKNNKSLIDSITTSKLNVSDVVDNLTTNVSNKALSAKQGIALKNLIDAIVVPTKTSQLTNDSNYLTSHQDISGKVDKTKITLGIHTDGLVYVFIDGSPVGTGIEQTGELGDVVGVVDSNKNITLTGNLADGTYILKYKMDDGSTINIGTLNINVINYTNLIPTSVTNDGVTIYNETGYKNDVRLRTDGIEEAVLAGQFATGFIPVVVGDTIRIKGATYNNNYTKIVGYDDSFATRTDEFYVDSWNSSYWTIAEESDGTLSCILKANNTIKWARFTAVGNGANIIITKNEEIK